MSTAQSAFVSSARINPLTIGGRTNGPPKTIAHSKKLLSETQNTLEGLKDTLISGFEPTCVLDSVLQKIKLNIALKSTQGVCDEFGEMIKGFTKHSTDLRFSNRDRLVVSFHESKISRFNQQLGECQSTISLAMMFP
jgi:Fungal N-terminal domain of STAND proteins